MHIKYLKYFILLLLLFLFSCNDEENSVNSNEENEFLKNIIIEEKEPVKVVTQTPDGRLFYRPQFIRYNKYDNNVYVVDSGNHRIVVFDEDLNYIKEFGTYGQGPGELNKPSGIEFNKKGDVIIVDLGNNRVQIFDNKFEYISEFKLILVIGPRYYVRTDSKNRIYQSYQGNGFLMTVRNKNGDEISKFGDIFEYNPKNYEAGDNAIQFIIDSDDYIYCIFINHPILRKYDKNYNLIYESNLEYMPAVKKVKETWEVIMGEKKKENNTYTYLYKYYTHFVSADKELLYVGFAGEEYYPIYVFDKNSAKIEKKIILKHENSVFLNFDFSSNNYIYAVNSLKRKVVIFNK